MSQSVRASQSTRSSTGMWNRRSGSPPLQRAYSTVSSSREVKKSNAASVYGGAGGRGSRISRATSFTAISAGGIGGNEKEELQGLNTRLSGYLNRVRSLEQENNKLELEIAELMRLSKRGSHDWPKWDGIFKELREQIFVLTMESTKLELGIQNTDLARSDYEEKWETEHAIRMAVEADIQALRKMIDDTNVARLNLESRVEALKEELALLRHTHAEEVKKLMLEISSFEGASVEVDGGRDDIDLNKALAEIRRQYEELCRQNAGQVESTYLETITITSTKVTEKLQALEKHRLELTELRSTTQGLFLELENWRSKKLSLEDALANVSARYEMEVSSLRGMVIELDKVLVEINVDLERQRSEYEMLTNAKMRLEQEIAYYSSLLDQQGHMTIGGKSSGTTTTVTSIKYSN